MELNKREEHALSIFQPFPGILHVIYPNNLMLGRGFMRVQEFYESPLGDFKGRYFTRDEFKEAYAKFKGTGTGWGEFTYHEDWVGFNVPGNVFDEFLKVFDFDIDTSEERLVEAIKRYRRMDGQYYVIGTVDQGHATTIEHELSHAFWYLDPNYRKRAIHLMSELPMVFDAMALGALTKMGYHHDVIDDEVTAYLSTSTMADMVDTFKTTDIPWKVALKFQQQFADYLEDKEDERE